MATKRTTTTVTTKTVTTKHARTQAKTVFKTMVKLSAPEEKVLRMRKGMGVDLEAPLERKSANPEILAKLRDIEAQLFLQAGLVQGVSKKQLIIDKLRKK